MVEFANTAAAVCPRACVRAQRESCQECAWCVRATFSNSSLLQAPRWRAACAGMARNSSRLAPVQRDSKRAPSLVCRSAFSLAALVLCSQRVLHSRTRAARSAVGITTKARARTDPLLRAQYV